jgi:hypothetical protein
MRSQPEMHTDLLTMSSMPTGVIGVPSDQKHSSSFINRSNPVFENRYVEAYKSLILAEAEKLYDKILYDLTYIVLGDMSKMDPSYQQCH